MKLYEGMFVIDNDLVREDWQAAKSLVTGTLEKHGATVHTARRWDERALAYPIKGRRRATYLLTYFEIEGDRNTDVARDLEITDGVLRYLVTSAAAVPEGEAEASQAEQADDFQLPPPPPDSVGRYSPLQGDVEEENADGEESSEGGDEAKAEECKADEAKAEGSAEGGAGQADEPSTEGEGTKTEEQA